ncbi:hypothetical protein KOXY103107_06425 [Komagataeibacter xylinus]
MQAGRQKRGNGRVINDDGRIGVTPGQALQRGEATPQQPGVGAAGQVGGQVARAKPHALAALCAAGDGNKHRLPLRQWAKPFRIG